MYLQRLITITTYAIVTSTILLTLYWLFYHFFSEHKRSSKSDDLNSEIEEFLKSQTQRNKKIYQNIMSLQSVLSAMLIVAFAFFIVGGVCAEFYKSEILLLAKDPARQVAIFGWLLWALLLSILNLLEGFIAIFTQGIIASYPLGRKRVRVIRGQEAVSFGVMRIFSGFIFLLLIFYYIMSII